MAQHTVEKLLNSVKVGLQPSRAKLLSSKLHRDQTPRLRSAKISLQTLFGISIYTTNINQNNFVI